MRPRRHKLRYKILMVAVIIVAAGRLIQVAHIGAPAMSHPPCTGGSHWTTHWIKDGPGDWATQSGVPGATLPAGQPGTLTWFGYTEYGGCAGTFKGTAGSPLIIWRYQP